MSVQFTSEHVCYVNCNYCNTILVVNVPNNCSYNIVTVRCGHCTMVLSMDLAPFHQARTVQDHQKSEDINSHVPNANQSAASVTYTSEEIQRIKTSNPEISHREAFSAAAKNWAHLPRLHFGLSVADGGGGGGSN
uniref:Uncharacterized protein n=1 Tax=Oryza meridionalis TaxID=40149 RepID=A0A0E0E7N1_9ORYZ